jgi:hypothetical protein
MNKFIFLLLTMAACGSYHPLTPHDTRITDGSLAHIFPCPVDWSQGHCASEIARYCDFNGYSVLTMDKREDGGLSITVVCMENHPDGF